MKRIKAGSFEYENAPYITGYASVAGKKEGEGPLGKEIDRVFQDNLLGRETWEQAESALVQEAVNLCIDKAGLTAQEIDAVFSGDLLNQCVASTFGLRSFQIPDVGMYGACSTMALTMISASMLVEAGGAERCIAATSSHFSSAERQYRTPLQYGGQRTPSAQWTVTGAGAVVISKENGRTTENYGGGNRVRIRRATLGIVRELGVKDANNMGAAMAPAAADTIMRFLKDHRKSPQDYDIILTGDLGLVGSRLMVELLAKEKVDISQNHSDGGLMIFDRKNQDVHAGGSGCGCSAVVLCSNILPRMELGELRRVLFVATGALLSPTTIQQGEPIPGIAHAVELIAE